MPSKNKLSKGKAQHQTSKSGRPRKPDSLAPPNWPPLEPLVPSIDLSIEVLSHNQILVIRNFFTSTLCKNLKSFLADQPLITTPTTPKAGDAVRVNDRIQFDDYAFSQHLWRTAGLEGLMRNAESISQESAPEQATRIDWGGDLVGLNPRIRVYRYSQGQFFGQHYDESNMLMLPTEPPTPVKTTWTLLIYLTGASTGCAGGETVFYPDLGPAKSFSGKSNEVGDPISVEPEVGMALLHKHGQDCLLHEGKRVEKGEKWVLRSDICVRR